MFNFESEKMREIKFRGKRLDNGEWVDGDLHIRTALIHIHPELGGRVIIYPETVGQFTGLLDKNGKEIYEGDVVRTLSGFVGYMRYNERFIRFEVAAPYESYDNEREPDGVPYESWEVIGNIHDNPKLLNL